MGESEKLDNRRFGRLSSKALLLISLCFFEYYWLLEPPEPSEPLEPPEPSEPPELPELPEP